MVDTFLNADILFLSIITSLYLIFKTIMAIKGNYLTNEYFNHPLGIISAACAFCWALLYFITHIK